MHGSAIALAGGVPIAVRDLLSELGAGLATFPDQAAEEQAQAWAQAHCPIDALVYDAAPAFGLGGDVGLRAALDNAWLAVWATATGALIPNQAGGRVVLITPPPDVGSYAEAARSALENLARTLSIEWARHAITTTAIAPGLATSESEVATLVAYLLSPAGGYFSGCRLELNGR